MARDMHELLRLARALFLGKALGLPFGQIADAFGTHAQLDQMNGHTLHVGRRGALVNAVHDATMRGMKLYYTEKSPYARLVRAVAHARGITLECVNPGHPLHDPAALHAANPLGKIPCLELDDGTWLLDSRVCLAYLNKIGGVPLLPEVMADHNLLALGYGVLDAAVNSVLETAREVPSDAYITRQLGKIERALAHVEMQAGELPVQADAAHLSVAVAYSYLTFRLPMFEALIADAKYAKLDAWHQKMARLACMQATYPNDL